MKHRTRSLVLVALTCALMLALVPGSAFASSGAQGDIDQCANGAITAMAVCSGAQWQNGNLNGNQAHYFEGDSVPYRAKLTSLTALQQYVVTIQWDTTKSGKHALDYITNYDRTETTGAADPTTFHENQIDACSDVIATCARLNPDSHIAIPVDTDVTTGIGHSYTPGDFEMWGGHLDSVGSYVGSGDVTGDSSKSITITFTAQSDTAVLAWGGHIATRQDWGSGNSAINISGSPYHMRLLNLSPPDHLGNQDRSLTADAVIFPASVTIVKHVNAGSDTFPFSASGTGLTFPYPAATDTATAFNLNAGASDGTINSNRIVTFGNAQSVTEGSEPSSLWSFDSLSCSIAHDLTGSTGTAAQDGGNQLKADFNLQEGDRATCTYTNDFTPANPGLSTTAETPVVVGDTIHDSATLSDGSSPTGTITFEVFAPGDTSCDTPLEWPDGHTSQDVTVDNGNDTYDSPNFTTTEPGDYHWIATYTSGDANNNDNASAQCGDDGETSHVKAQPSISTSADSPVVIGNTISDTATLADGVSPTGTITFEVFAPGDTSCDTPLDWGNGDTSKSVDADGNGNYPSPSFTTAASGDYHWIASYSGDGDNAPASGQCGDDGETSHVKAQPSFTTTATDGLVGGTVHDSATVTGGVNMAGQTIHFDAYATSNCSGQPVYSHDGTVVDDGEGNLTATSGNFAPSTAGTYYWVAGYAGNADNNGFGPTACGDMSEGNHERSVVTAGGLHVVKDGSPAIVHDGDQITFTYDVTNPGSAPVTVDSITDDKCSPVSGPTQKTGGNQDNLLDPGETWVYTCTATAKQSDETTDANGKKVIVNTVTVTGHDDSDSQLTATDDHTTRVIHPAIQIDKVGPATAVAGDKIGYVLTVTNPGDTSFAASTVVVSDPICNGDPVTLIGKGGDPSPDSLDPGDVWTYSCSVQTAVGATVVNNTASVQGTDVLGTSVSSADAATTTMSQPQQLVLPERITPGSAKLVAPTGCVARAFNARVRGAQIAKVVFFLDGKKKATLIKPNKAGVFQLRIDPRKLKLGVHRVVVNVVFNSKSGTKPKTIRLSFQRCGRKLITPRFTG